MNMTESLLASLKAKYNKVADKQTEATMAAWQSRDSQERRRLEDRANRLKKQLHVLALQISAIKGETK